MKTQIIPGVWEDLAAPEKYEPKYGSYIRDLSESIAASDWAMVERDLAALRRHHQLVLESRRRGGGRDGSGA